MKLSKLWPYLLILLVTSVYFIYLLFDSRYFFYDDFTAFVFVLKRSYWQIITDSLLSRDVDRHKIVGYLATKLIHSLAGFKVEIYFFALFLIHTLNSCLLFTLLHRLTRAKLISAFLAAIFAYRFYLWWFSNIHTLLAGTFFLIITLLWLTYLKQRRQIYLLSIWILTPIMVYSYGPTFFLFPALILLTQGLTLKEARLKIKRSDPNGIKPLIPLVILLIAYFLIYSNTQANLDRFLTTDNPYYRPLNISTFIYTQSVYIHELTGKLLPQSIPLTLGIWATILFLTFKTKPRLVLFLLAFLITIAPNSFFPKHTMFYYLYSPITFIFIFFAFLLKSKNWLLALFILLILFNPSHNLYSMAFRLKHPAPNFEKQAMQLIIDRTDEALEQGNNQISISNWFVTPNLRSSITYQALPLFLHHPQKDNFIYSYDKESETLIIKPKP